MPTLDPRAGARGALARRLREHGQIDDWKRSDPQASDATAQRILQHARAAKLHDALVSSTELVTVAGITSTALSVGAAAFAPDQADLTTGVRLGGRQVLASHEILANNTLYVKAAGASTWHAYPVSAVASAASNPVGA